jgi:hypothetical protein
VCLLLFVYSFSDTRISRSLFHFLTLLIKNLFKHEDSENYAKVELLLQVQIVKMLSIISYQNEHIIMGIRCISILTIIVEQTIETTCFLYEMIVIVQKSSNSECDVPLSEPLITT